MINKIGYSLLSVSKMGKSLSFPFIYKMNLLNIKITKLNFHEQIISNQCYHSGFSVVAERFKRKILQANSKCKSKRISHILNSTRPQLHNEITSDKLHTLGIYFLSKYIHTHIYIHMYIHMKYIYSLSTHIYVILKTKRFPDPTDFRVFVYALQVRHV